MNIHNLKNVEWSDRKTEINKVLESVVDIGISNESYRLREMEARRLIKIG